MCGVVYRGTCPETLLIDEDGRLQVSPASVLRCLPSHLPSSLCLFAQRVPPDILRCLASFHPTHRLVSCSCVEPLSLSPHMLTTHSLPSGALIA